MVKRMIFCCGRVQKKGNRKRELRDSLIRGEKPRIGFDKYKIDPPSIYDTITLDSTYTIDEPTKKKGKGKGKTNVVKKTTVAELPKGEGGGEGELL